MSECGKRELRVAGGTWQVDPRWEHVLFDQQGLRLEEWLASGRATPVKEGAGRIVYRIDLPQAEVYLKYYRVRGLRASGRVLLGRSPAQREHRAACRLLERQVPTTVPLAWGESRTLGLASEHFFITQGVSGAITLAEFLDGVLPQLSPRQQSRARREIVVELARFCAALHRAGIYHDDLHLGNLLVRVPCGTEAGSVEFYLIDLPRVRIGRPLSWRRSCQNLVMLNADWGRNVSRSERWRFWRAYLAARPELGQHDPRARAAEVAARTRCYVLRLARRRDKRALVTNRDFVRHCTPAGTLWAVRDLAAEVATALLASPSKWLRNWLHQPVKLSCRSVVVQASLPLHGGACTAAFKRYRAASPGKRLLALLRESRARRAWRLGHALLARGIATPRPLAAIELRGARRRGESYLATEWMAGALNLHEYLWQLASLATSDRQRRMRALAASLGRLLARLHWWNLSHADLKGCNILVVDHQGGLSTALADVESIRFHRRLSFPRRARDLARLAASLEAHPWVTRGDRLRFLRAYLSGLPANAQRDWRQHWRLIGQFAAAIVRRFARRGKTLA